PPGAARLAPSGAERSDVLRPERSARSPDIRAQGDGSACWERNRPAWGELLLVPVLAPYMRLVGSPMPPLITAPCHRIKPAGRVRFPAGCCSRAQTASGGSKVGRLSQPGAAPRQ